MAQCLPDFVGLQFFVVSTFCLGAVCALDVIENDDMNIIIESIVNFFIEFDIFDIVPIANLNCLLKITLEIVFIFSFLNGLLPSSLLFSLVPYLRYKSYESVSLRRI